MMKRTILMTLITLVLMVLFCISGMQTSKYYKEVTVTEISQDNVTTEDEQGNEWVFNGEGFEVGQKITLKMDIHHTDNVTTDDVVEGVVE